MAIFSLIRLRTLLTVFALVIMSVAAPGVAMARPKPVVGAEQCLGDGYLTVTSVRGASSTFRNERQCLSWAKRGKPLYLVPTAQWSTAVRTGDPTWCDLVLTASNLDPKSSYQVHYVIDSAGTAGTLDYTATMAQPSPGTGVMTIPYEACSSAPYLAWAELLDANGQAIATAGPVQLF